jgi:argininosuccinate lyase
LKKDFAVLTTYQREHLFPTYALHAPRLYPEIVEASRAHVVMLAEQNLIPRERAQALLNGLQELRSGGPGLPEYDGTFEDVYYAFERNLAAVAGIEPHSLDVQLARSRNDLDAGIFRMILRDQVESATRAAANAAMAALDAAERTTEAVVIGLTHRRPAQPTTLAHILAGYAEALIGEVRVYDSVLNELQSSPLGACAFAGTDLPINPSRVSELLGFERQIVNSYESVAGADHLMAVSFANARALATGARLARLIQDWMTWGWIDTPAEFCQGSSIMPQKRNPVVLEHMVSMSGMESADATSVINNVSAAWWEDSNNATTDVQVRLWESNDRARRFFTLLERLLSTLAVLKLPSAEQLVDAGVTTTAAADVLSRAGVPFRAAHDVLGVLIRSGSPFEWDSGAVRDSLATVAAELKVSDETIDLVIKAARDPRVVLSREQKDGPGADAVNSQIVTLRASLVRLQESVRLRRERILQAGQALDSAVESVLS